MKLPNIPGVTEKTVNGALGCVDQIQEGKYIRTAKSSMNRIQQEQQAAEKDLSPTNARAAKHKNSGNGSNLVV